MIRDVGLIVPTDLPNPEIKQITSDSRSVQNGSLFLGLPGEKFDGGSFWREALNAGASAAVIGSSAALLNPPGCKDAVMVLPEPVEKWIGEFAAGFWDKPSLKLKLIGITGTNGKTTTAHLIEHLSSALGESTALFGTLVNRWPGNTSSASFTTSFADNLQAQIAAAVDSGVKFCAMEVSSHALAQQRVSGCRFSGAIFTNLTQDHLDYHSSMEEYFGVKSQLFESNLLEEGASKAVVNVDDPWGEKLAERLGERCWRSTLSEDVPRSSQVSLALSDLNLSVRGIEGLLISPLGEGRFISPLVGRFNLMNLLQSVGVLLQHGLPLQDLLDGIPDFPGVPGRMERVTVPEDDGATPLPMVLVDYAHTPDGLKNALAASRAFSSRKLVCVFGCGGDRDRTKRSKMGAIAAQLSDHLVITSDNPRTEDPEQIASDVLSGVPIGKSKMVELDREKAILKAIAYAEAGDVVLVAGKGHEDYQIIGLEKIYFDDRQVVKTILKDLLLAH